MAVVYEDTCFGLFAFVVNLISKKKKEKKRKAHRQTDRQNLWLYSASFPCQTTKQSYKIIR